MKDISKAFIKAVCYDENKCFQLHNKIDINDLVPLSQTYRLEHLLYFSLKKNNVLAELAAKNHEILKNAYDFVSGTNYNRLSELNVLDNSFKREDIEWLLLKEYAFDDTYSDLGAVRQGDFDILIGEENLEQGRQLLFSLGYEFHESRYGESYGEFRFKNPEKTSIDLHIRLMPNKHDWIFNREDYKQIISAVEVTECQGIVFKHMNPLFGSINMLIHTILHHNFYPLSKMVNCNNYLVSKQDLVDWNEVASKLISLGISNLGWFSLNFMKEIIGHKSVLLDKLEVPSDDDIKGFREIQPHPAFYYEPETYKRFDDLTHQLDYKLFLFDKQGKREQIKEWEGNGE